MSSPLLVIKGTVTNVSDRAIFHTLKLIQTCRRHSIQFASVCGNGNQRASNEQSPYHSYDMPTSQEWSHRARSIACLLFSILSFGSQVQVSCHWQFLYVYCYNSGTAVSNTPKMFTLSWSKARYHTYLRSSTSLISRTSYRSVPDYAVEPTATQQVLRHH